MHVFKLTMPSYWRIGAMQAIAEPIMICNVTTKMIWKLHLEFDLFSHVKYINNNYFCKAIFPGTALEPL